MQSTDVSFFASYGASLIIGTPLLMGSVAAYQFNRAFPRSYTASVGLGVATVSFACVALLLFALEGLICIMMAAPLLLPLGALGGLMGKAIADSTRRPARELLAAVLLLPGLAFAESRWAHTMELEVMTPVEVEAPPEVVWRHVVDFPDLQPPTEWYFRWGIACPQRARIFGFTSSNLRKPRLPRMCQTKLRQCHRARLKRALPPPQVPVSLIQSPKPPANR